MHYGYGLGSLIGMFLITVIYAVVVFLIIRYAVRANSQVKILEKINAKQTRQIELLEQLVQQQQKPNPIE